MDFSEALLVSISIAILIIVLIIVPAICSFYDGVEAGTNDMKDAAVKSGHAEYYLDEKMEKQWRWK